MVETLRRLIASVAPEAHEIIYHDALGYGPTDSGFDRIMYVTVFEKHLNIGFFFGGFLPDPEGLLLGNGKRMRHIKIRSLQEAEHLAIQRLLAPAWADGLSGSNSFTAAAFEEGSSGRLLSLSCPVCASEPMACSQDRSQAFLNTTLTLLEERQRAEHR